MHLCGRSTKKSDLRDSATSLSVLTGGPVYGVKTGERSKNGLEPLQLLQGNRQNRPRGKRGEYDEAI